MPEVGEDKPPQRVSFSLDRGPEGDLYNVQVFDDSLIVQITEQQRQDMIQKLTELGEVGWDE